MPRKKQSEAGALEAPAKTETKPEQPNLFGDEDFVFNTIHTQLAMVRGQIVDCGKAIERKKKEVESLQKIEAALSKSSAIVKKRRDALKKEEQNGKSGI